MRLVLLRILTHRRSNMKTIPISTNIAHSLASKSSIESISSLIPRYMNPCNSYSGITSQTSKEGKLLADFFSFSHFSCRAVIIHNLIFLFHKCCRSTIGIRTLIPLAIVERLRQKFRSYFSMCSSLAYPATMTTDTFPGFTDSISIFYSILHKVYKGCIDYLVDNVRKTQLITFDSMEQKSPLSPIKGFRNCARFIRNYYQQTVRQGVSTYVPEDVDAHWT